jgi:hypothetical protein
MFFLVKGPHGVGRKKQSKRGFYEEPRKTARTLFVMAYFRVTTSELL